MLSDNLNIFYQNTRGLRTKTHVFKRNLSLHSFDIIALTETWLLDGLADSELFDSRYLIWRRDRDYRNTREKYGGGVLLAVRRDLAAELYPEWSSSAEDIWVSIKIKRNHNKYINLHVCSLYLCKENFGNSFNLQLQNFCDKLSINCNSCPNDIFLVMGDFNLNNLDWKQSDSNSYLNPVGASGDAQLYLMDVLTQSNLYQFNCNKNINNRILDLVFCNDIDIIKVHTCVQPLVPEDNHHPSLHIVLNLEQQSTMRGHSRLKYYFEKGNYDAINTELMECNWDVMLKNTLLDVAVNTFYEKLRELIEKHIPHKLINPDNSFPPWFNSCLKKVLKEKNKYLKKFNIYKNTSDYNTFSLLRKRAKFLEQSCYDLYISRIENSINTDPKQFWSYIKSNRKGSKSFPATMYYNGQKGETGEQISNLFATYFQSVFLPPSNNSQSEHEFLFDVHSTIGNITINNDNILKELQSLDVSKGSGPDRIVPIFILRCAESLTTPLSILYTRSISEGIVPKIWKTAFITPIHKNGNRSEIKNYRPISKLCIFAKILEKIVRNQVYSALSSWFIPEQHGFISKRSTTSNLTSFTNFLASNMESGGQVDAIFTDFSKAFDRIDHNLLLTKILAAGIHGNLFRWFTSYIQNRSQVVVLQGYESLWYHTPSGVPQGSLLGPLLFNIFINDISSCFKHTQSLLYADDMKIYKTIFKPMDQYELQLDLNVLQEYCHSNKLDLNVSKCYSITFTRKSKPLINHYTLKDQHLTRVNTIRDLGIIHDHKFLYDAHIEDIMNRANKMLGFVLRSSSEFKNIKVIKILYCSLVRSVLEYGSIIWNPMYDRYINRLESIQKRFLRFLEYKTKISDSGYNMRCVRHHILPLQQRRLIADIIFLAKIAQGNVDSPSLLAKINLHVPSRLYRKFKYLHIPISKSNYNSNSFFIRSAHQINGLSDKLDIDLFNDKPHTIKQKLTDAWFSSGSQYN